MTFFVLLAAAGLGMLAFFEPCTIATHTLFAARAHRRPRQACCNELLLIWWVRSALLALLLGGATAVAGPVVLSREAAALGLLVLGGMYLLSRRVYLPVPHLAFHHLLPGGSRLPDAVRLGLTLPACTLPLLLVVGVLALMVDSIPLAILAGVVFASLFSLPVAIAARVGIGDGVRSFLGRAAHTAPYLTALLFGGVALALLWPQIGSAVSGMQATQLKAAFQEAGLAGIGVALVAGFVFSFNPVSFAAIPVVLAYVTRAHEERRALHLGGTFIAGMVLTHVVLGVAAAMGGEWVKGVMGREWGLLLGPLLILLGLMWPGWLRLRLPWFHLRGRRVVGMPGAFLLGIPFTVAICPFCAPALLVALTASAAVGSVSFGAGLLLAFALGRSLPILLGAWAMGWLESLRVLTGYQRGFEVFGGIVLMLSGLYLLNEYFFVIPY